MIRERAQNFIRELAEDVRADRKIDLNSAKEITQEMIGSLTRNKDALLSLIPIQNKNDYFINHPINISILMTSLCLNLGLAQEQVGLFAVGALLHDLGEFLIPREILNKKGSYTREEYKTMKQHPARGKDILNNMDNMQPEVTQVVYEHHERLNGSGYPRGLTEEQISLGGRLAAIVDSYSALTSNRLHRDGDTPPEVIKYLFELAGSEFDQELMQALLHTLGLYPVGNLVRLSSGFLAIVVGAAGDNLLKPTVLLVYDTKKKRTVAPRKLDLSKGVGELHQISGIESTAQWGLNHIELINSSG